MNIEYDEAALQELRDIIDWYNEQHPGLGNDFLDKFDLAIGSIVANPFAWPELVQATRCYLTDQFPYKIIYIPDDLSIRVIAISHGKRQAGYWLARLKH